MRAGAAARSPRSPSLTRFPPPPRSAVEAIKALREIKPNDQYLPSFVITDAEGKPNGTIQDGDAVALFNFRADRMVELSKAFEYDDFAHFDRVRFPKTKFVGIMQYDGDLKLPKNFLIPPPDIQKTSGEWLAKNGVRTFACSETQKFGHVTFFWNGNRSARPETRRCFPLPLARSLGRTPAIGSQRERVGES